MPGPVNGKTFAELMDDLDDRLDGGRSLPPVPVPQVPSLNEDESAEMAELEDVFKTLPTMEDCGGQTTPRTFYEGLKREGALANSNREVPYKERYQPKPRWWHTQIVDYMIANPGVTRKALAQVFGRTEVMMGHIVNSDMFQAALVQRQKEISDGCDAAIGMRLRQVAAKSLDKLHERIEHNPKVPTKDIIAVADRSLNALGYGVKVKESEGAATPAVTVIQANVINEARDILREQEKKITTIDSTPQKALPSIPQSTEVGS